jgi:hypothetical protein
MANDHFTALGQDPHVAWLARWREQLARLQAEAVRKAQVFAAESVHKVEVAAVCELADRLTAELADARRPWWRRWRG